jgi:hypothetical protein
MKFIECAFVCSTILLAMLAVSCNSNKEAKTPGLEEAVSTAVDAYLYGYPGLPGIKSPGMTSFSTP